MKAMRFFLPAAAVLLAGGIFLLRPDAEPAAAPGITPAPATAAVPASPRLAGHAAATPASGVSAAPPDVPAEEWRRIKAVMAATPEGRQDLARVGEYLTFRYRMAKWQQAKAAGADTAARADLAQFLLDGMATHVARREITAGEAHALTTALLQDRIDDPAALRAAVAAQLEKLRAAQPAPDPQQQARQQAAWAAYQQREAAIVAQWQSLPAAQRQPRWLEDRLDAARRETLEAL